MSLFEKGKPKTGGRAKGARNKLSVAFLEAFAADFEEHGAEVIKIVRVEKPSEYLKTAAYLMPKEFEISETRLMEIPDDELDAFIEFARRRIAERALGAAEMSGTSDYIGSAAHSCSLSNLIHRAGSLMRFIAGFVVALIIVAGAAALVMYTDGLARHHQ